MPKTEHKENKMKTETEQKGNKMKTQTLRIACGLFLVATFGIAGSALAAVSIPDGDCSALPTTCELHREIR